MSEFTKHTAIDQERPIPAETEANTLLSNRLKKDLKLDEKEIAKFWSNYIFIQRSIIEILTEGMDTNEANSLAANFAKNEATIFTTLLTEIDTPDLYIFLCFKTESADKKTRLINKLLKGIRPFHKSTDKRLKVKTKRPK
ncbi:MAG: hypothetical protein PHQ18_00570 [Patescibacteria group bacterium]|nr:hypothetical protein [Patescibacteria group bacterium]